MNGVEILSQSEVVAATTFNDTACCVAFGISMTIFIGLGIWWAFAAGKADLFFITALGGLIISTLIACGIVDATSNPIAYETHYKVTIDDSVSMNEFNEKYEILDQEGKIYTVKERE